MAHIKDHITIEASPTDVHKLARDPNTWSAWFVGLDELEGMKGDGGPGTHAQHHYVLAGVRFPLESTVIEDRADPDGSYHWRGEFSGPLAGWHTWDYMPTDMGCEVDAEMEYTVPGKALGKVADRVVVERMQERALHESLERLKLLMERAKH